jgi:putative flippase GtrA
MIKNKEFLLAEFMKLVKYGFVGVLNTLLCIATMYVFRTIGLGYQLYTLIGYVVAIIFSFFMNKQFTFNYKADGKRAVIIRMIRFISVSISLLLLVQLLEWIFIDRMMLPEILGIGIPMVIYTMIGFVLNRFWVFT